QHTAPSSTLGYLSRQHWETITSWKNTVPPARTMESGKAHRGTATASAAIVGATLALATQFAAAAAADADISVRCDPSSAVHIRWSEEADRMYVENGSCVTMSDLYQAGLDEDGFNHGPVYPFNTAENTKTESPTG
ncbi:unnamed protein product, partial [Pylaiella littoralis]